MSSCIENLGLSEKIINEYKKDNPKATSNPVAIKAWLEGYLFDLIADRNTYLKKAKLKDLILTEEEFAPFIAEDAWINFTSIHSQIFENIDKNRGKVNPVTYLFQNFYQYKDTIQDLLGYLEQGATLKGKYAGSLAKSGKALARRIATATELKNLAISLANVKKRDLIDINRDIPKAYRDMANNIGIELTLNQMQTDANAYINLTEPSATNPISTDESLKQSKRSVFALQSKPVKFRGSKLKGTITNIRNLPILNFTFNDLKAIKDGNVESIKELFKDSDKALNKFKQLVELLFNIDAKTRINTNTKLGSYNEKIDPTLKVDTGVDEIFNGLNLLYMQQGNDPTASSNYSLPMPIRLLALKTAIEWLATSGTLRWNDNETIQAKFLNDPNVVLDNSILNKFRTVGLLKNTVERSIGGQIYAQLGIKLDDKLFEQNAHIDEILKNSLGQYAIRLLIEAGYISDIFMPTGVDYLSNEETSIEDKMYLQNRSNPQSFFKHFIKLNVDTTSEVPLEEQENFILQKDFAEFISSEDYSAMEKIILGQKETDLGIRTEPPQDITQDSPEVQLNDFNHGVKQAVDTINHHQKTPYELNATFNALVDALGVSESNVEPLAELLGHTPLDGKFKALHETIEGQNLSIRAALNSYFEFRKRLATGNISKFYFRFKLWMMGRIGAAPDIANPQIYKWHREAFTAKRWTRNVDINNAKQMDLFKIGVISLLTKDLNKLSKEKFIESFDSYMETNKDVLDELLKQYENKNSEKLLKTLKDLKIDSAAKFNGIAQLLNYLKAQKDNQNTFSVTLTGEVDATTSGTTIGALISTYSNEGREVLDKIGVYTSNSPFKRFLDFKNEGGFDTYQSVGIDAGKIAEEWFRDSPNKLTAINELVTDLFDRVGEAVSSELRDLAKGLTNPVQYGSQAGPINRNVVGYFIDHVNKKIQSINDDTNKSEEQKYAELKEIGTKLDTISTVVGRANRSFMGIINEAGSFDNFFNTFEWSAQDIKRIQNTFSIKKELPIGKVSYGEMVKRSVDRRLGDISSVRQNVIMMHNGINQIMTYVFNKLVQEKIDAGIPVTNQVRKEILDSLLKIRPLLPSIYTKDNLKEYTDNTKYEGIASLENRDLKSSEGKEPVSVIRPKNPMVKDGNLQTVDATPENGREYTETNPVLFIEPISISARPGPFYIHSIDSSAMYRITQLAKDAGIDFYPIHDAVVFSVFDMQEMADIANRAYAELMLEHNPLIKLKEYYEQYETNLQEVLDKNSIVLPTGSVSNFLSTVELKDYAAELGIKEKKDNTSTDTQEEPVVEDVSLEDRVTFSTGLQEITDTANNHSEFVKEQRKGDLIFDIFVQPTEPYTVTGTEPNVLGSETKTSFDAETVIASTKVNADNLSNIFDALNNIDNVEKDPEHLSILKSIISLVGSRLNNKEFDLEQYAFENKNFGEIEDNKIRLNTSLHPIFSALNLSAQEVYTHELVHAITRALLESSTFFRNKIRQLYDQAAKQLTPEDFLARNADGSVRIVQDYETELKEAKARYDYIFNNPKTGIHEFVAFGLTNKQVIKALSTLKKEVVPESPQTIFHKLLNWFNSLLSHVYDRWTGRDKMTMDKELFSLVQAMTEVNKRAGDTLLGQVNAGFIYANRQVGKVFAGVYAWSDVPEPNRLQKTIKVLGSMRTIVQSDAFKFALATLQDKAVKQNIAILKHILFAATQIPFEAKGMSSDVSEYKLFILRSKHDLDVTSNEIRSTVFKHLQEAFGDTEVTANDAISLNFIMTKSDITALNYSLPDMVKLLKDSKFIKQEIAKREQALEDTGYKNRYIRYAKALGYFMINKSSPVDLIALNAENIADQTFTGNPIKVNNRDEVIKTIDELKSLYALSYVHADHKTNVIKLIKKEHARDPEINGITTLYDHLKDFKEKSKQDLFDNNGSMMQAGYDAEITDDKVDIQYSEDPNDQEFIKTGYKQMGELKKDPADTGPVKYIYVNPYGGKEAWNRGGLVLMTKTSFGTKVAPSNLDVKALLDKARANMDNPELDFENSHLVPIVSPDKYITGVRYVMSEKHRIEYLKKDENIFTNIGSMESAYTRKLAVNTINKEGMDILYRDYRRNYARNPGMYVVLNNDDDSQYKDLYRMLPYETREYAKELFNGDIYIKAEVLNAMIGYRDLSISNMKGMDRNSVRIAERGLKEVITHLKTNWVIKTPVMLNNIRSNISAGFLLGVPMDYWIKNQLEGAYLVDDYMKKHKKAMMLEFKLVSKARMSESTRKSMENKLETLRADIQANPMTKYINMGLLSSIVEDVEVQDEIEKYSLRNQVEAYFDKTVGNKVPKQLKSMWSHLYLTKDHPVYKALYKATQYSDLTAKYATIKYFTQERGMNEEDAIKVALDTFIEYDSVTSPLLKYTNDIGLTPFTKYRIRIQKRIFQNFGENPANTAAMVMFDNMVNTPNIIQGMDVFPINLATPMTYGENAVIVPGMQVVESVFGI